MTPTHGTPLSSDQAAYDADQDARIRRLRAQGLALGAVLAALIVVAVARTSRPQPAALAPSPVVHVAAAPACPACPPCAACPACPASVAPGRRR